MIEVGTYYRKFVVSEHESDIPKGAVVLVTQLDMDALQVHFAHDGTHYFNSIENFIGEFRKDPKGFEKRQKDVLALMEDVRDLGVEFNKNLLTVTKTADDVQGTEIIQADPAAPDRAKREIAATKGNAMRLRIVALKKAKQLSALLDEQSELLRHQVEGLEEVVDRANEAIWMINLYLGKEERIDVIRKGEPAAAEVPIHIRQLVLNMDEESVLCVDQGGIGYQNVDDFCKWVQKPENLQQVLPEEKGIIALQPRSMPRRRKHFSQGEDAADVHTYFLLRNGERLVLLDTDLEVWETLFPKKGELDRFFVTDEYDWEKRKSKKVPVRPGTSDYGRAMKEAGKRRRHYLRILLLMQGVLDRTPVFKPMEGDSINICDPREQERSLRFIRDAEATLPTGRKSFSDWLKEVNSQTRVGHRVMTVTHTDYSLSRQSFSLGRGAHYVPNSGPHVTDKMDGHQLGFLFDQSEGRRDDDRYVPEKRGRCWIQMHTETWLNFDAVVVEDMQYYLTSRVNRDKYASMFPILRRAITLKAAEQKKEAPFRKLLAAAIREATKVTVETADLMVIGLVAWYKFKNLVHRSLTKDDKKALRMILKEAKLRIIRTGEYEVTESATDLIVATLQKRHPNAVYIGHKKAGEFVVLSAENDENTFVAEAVYRIKLPKTEQELQLVRRFTKRLKHVTLLSEKAWQVVTGRRLSWRELWTHASWGKWTVDISRGSVISDPDKKEVIETAFEMIREEIKESRKRKRKNRTKRFVPLVVACKDREVEVYVHKDNGCLQRSNPVTRHSEGPSMKRYAFLWSRPNRKIKVEFDGGSLGCQAVYRADHHWMNPWELPWTKRGFTLLWSDDKKLASFEKTRLTYVEFKKASDKLEQTASAAYHQAAHAVKEVVKQRAYEVYLEELGEPELWEDYWKEQKESRHEHWPHSVKRALDRVVENGVDIDGKTIKWVFEKAKRYGFKGTEGDDGAQDEDIPFGMVIDLSDEEAEVEEEDEAGDDEVENLLGSGEEA